MKIFSVNVIPPITEKIFKKLWQTYALLGVIKYSHRRDTTEYSFLSHEVKGAGTPSADLVRSQPKGNRFKAFTLQRWE